MGDITAPCDYAFLALQILSVDSPRTISVEADFPYTNVAIISSRDAGNMSITGISGMV